MYYTIRYSTTEEYVNIGMVQVTASYYLEPKDKGYEKYIKEHLNGTPFRHHEKVFRADASAEEITKAFDEAAPEILDAYLDTDMYRLKNDPPDEKYEIYKKEFDTLPEEEKARLIEDAKRKLEVDNA